MVLITVIIFIASETVLQITVHAILQAEVLVDILEIVRENQPQQDRTQTTDQVFLVRIIDLVSTPTIALQTATTQPLDQKLTLTQLIHDRLNQNLEANHLEIITTLDHEVIPTHMETEEVGPTGAVLVPDGVLVLGEVVEVQQEDQDNFNDYETT